MRYFASLKDSLGRSEEQLAAANISTVRDVWRCANPAIPLPTHILAAVNMDYVDWDNPVQEGDEVAFFPPVTGG